MEKLVRITNKSGIHVRPAAQIAELANKFQASITFLKDSTEVNAKSIMELLTLGAGVGTNIIIKATGPDESQAVESIESLINAKFNEE